MSNNLIFGITLKADGSGLVGAVSAAGAQLKGLGEAGKAAGERGSEGVKKLIDIFGQSKRSAAELGPVFNAATQAVAAVAAKLKANPGDATLAREFERVKQAARAAKEEFVMGQATTEAARRSLAAQGVSVANLAEDYRRLKLAMANQPASIPSRAINSSGTTTRATAVNSVQPQLHQDGSANSAGDLSGRIDQLTSKLSRMGHISAAVFAAQQYILPYAAALGHLSDQYTSFNAQLRLGVGASGDFAQAQADVLRIATASATGLAETGKLYARLSSSVTRLGFDQRQVANVTETVGLALKVSGATAAESASAILQLSQSFGSGVLRGEEFNAVNEAAPRLMQALADAIGRPKEELRGLAEQGLLSSKVLALNLPTALGQLRAEAESMPLTIGQSFTLLENKMMLFIGRVNQGTGAFSSFSSGVKLLADNIEVALTLAGTTAAAMSAKVLQGVAARRAVERAAHIAALSEIAERTAAESLANRAALSGLARLGAAQTATAATSVAAMGTVGIAARGLLTALTGPVGIIVSIGLAAAAWIGFKDQSVSALDAAIAKAKELKEVQKTTGVKGARAESQDAKDLAQFQKDLTGKRQALEDAVRREGRGGVFQVLLGNSSVDVQNARAALAEGEAMINETRARLKAQTKQDQEQETARLAANTALADGKTGKPKKAAATQDKTAAADLKSQQDYMAAIGQTAQALLDEAAAAELANSLIGKTAEQLALATEARYNEQIASKGLELFRVQQIAGREAEVALLEMQIGALARLREAESAKPVLNAAVARAAADKKAADDAAQAAADAFKKRGEMISQTLSDALMRGFESGKGFAVNFGDTVKNIFKTMILEPRIKASVQPLADALNRIIDGFAKGIADALAQSNSGGGSWLSNIGSWLFSANGNAFTSQGLSSVLSPQPSVLGFARGDSFTNTVVSQPTAFQFGGGKLGVMGEAGPEAVMPLTRIGGQLGVRAEIANITGAASQRAAANDSTGLPAVQAGWQALAAGLSAVTNAAQAGLTGVAAALTLGLGNVSQAYASVTAENPGLRTEDGGLRGERSGFYPQSQVLSPQSSVGVGRVSDSVTRQSFTEHRCI